MDVKAWLEAAVADARRRGLPELVPLLENLARATAALRAADFGSGAPTDEASSRTPRRSRDN